MTLSEARNVLGFGPDEDPFTALAALKDYRERIAVLVRTAPNTILADRYQKRLLAFDKALAMIRESAEARGLLPVAAETAEVGSAAGTAPEPESAVEPPPRRWLIGWCVGVVVVLVGAAVAVLLWQQNEENKVIHRQARMALLEREGSQFVENRRWQEAARSFSQIDALAPGSELARLGQRSIEVGMAEEQTQFVGYWTGQAIAELESGRLDEAQSAIQRVLNKWPAEKEALATRARILAARSGQAREAAVLAARKFFDERRWDAAITACRNILVTAPDNTDAQSMLADATAARDKHALDQARAKSLLEEAVARDHGQFDLPALDALREAAALAPDNKEVAARLEKMASYTRTLRVPGDFATPAEALAAARDRDRIVLAPQTWKGPLVVNAAIELQGGGGAQTTIECAATAGSAITIGPDAKGVRISGITFRHESFHALGHERYSAALVRGGTVTFSDCRFLEASGHGLMVIDQGSAVANRCRFADNGWNGAAANGKACLLEVRDCEALNNFEHGIESWNGAAVTLVNNRCEGNCLNGIRADNGTAAATITDNQLIANREFGLVLDSAGAGKISGNIARSNLLGGLVIRSAAAAVAVTGNQATLNQGPGLVLEAGLPAASYAANSLTKNTPQQLLADVNFSQPETSGEPSSNKKAR